MKFLSDLLKTEVDSEHRKRILKSFFEKDNSKYCGALSPGNNDSKDPDDWQLKCTDVPGHQGKHAAGVQCGTLTWINEEVWYEK